MGMIKIEFHVDMSDSVTFDEDTGELTEVDLHNAGWKLNFLDGRQGNRSIRAEVPKTSYVSTHGRTQLVTAREAALSRANTLYCRI